MKPDAFRKIALSFTDAIESSHMGHPDFRAQGKIFATLGPGETEQAMVKLTQEQQSVFVAAYPRVFVPCNGAWGKHGCTNVHLPAARASMVRPALEIAFENVTPSSKKQKAKTRSNPKLVSRPKLSLSKTNRLKTKVLKILQELPEATAQPASESKLSLEVRGRRLGYFLINQEGDGRIALSLKANSDTRNALVEDSGNQFHIPKKFGRHGWVGVWLDAAKLDWVRVRTLIREAYALTAPKSLLKSL